MQTACVNERREKRNEIKKKLETMGCGRSCDMSGSKPLLYHIRGGTLAFADEVIGGQSDSNNIEPTGENNSDNVILPDDDNSKDETGNSTPAATSEQCANGHTWGEPEIAATCTEAGKKTKTCSVCGATESEEIAALGHSYGDDGKCTRCDEVQEAPPECEEHAWSDWTVTIAATCTTDGKKTRKCSVCPESETRVIDAAGHTWDNGTVTTEATCTEKGEKTYTCSVCGDTKTEEIEALGHDYVDGVCAICGATKPETEDPTGDPAVEGEQETPEHKAAIEAINALDDYISEIDEFLLSVTNEDGEIVGNDEYDADAAYAKLQEMLSNGLAMYNAIPLDGVELTADEENLLAGLKEALDGISGIMPIADAVAQIGDTTYETLSAAVAAATAEQTVTLLKDTTENIEINKAITLNLNNHTLTGVEGPYASVIKIDNRSQDSGIVTIKNGTITGGQKTKSSGGAIYISNDGKKKQIVNIDNCTITGNKAKDGAAIAMQKDYEVTINNCKITGNTATQSGGAIAISGYEISSTCTIKGNTNISGNTAGDVGGAISMGASASTYGETTTLTIEGNTSISGNSANSAGAIYVSGSRSRFVMNGGTISGNKAVGNKASTGFGGAISFAACINGQINGGTITGNSAVQKGGAIYAAGCGVKIEGVNTLNIGSSAAITGNTAPYGGGIYAKTYNTINPVTVNIANGAQLYNNEASTAGDDAYIEKDSKVTFPSIGSWTLDDCSDAIDGWYDDSEGSRWAVHDGNHVDQVSETVTGAKGIIAAHGVKTEEEDPTTPDPEPEEETPSNPSGGGSTTITDPETPTTEIPEDVTEIEEEDTPLADAEEVTVIEDEETALADVPQTGDSTNAWYLMTAFSALGLLWLALDAKKRKAESR